MIKNRKSLVRGLYELASLFALLNVIALTCVVVLFTVNGTLTKEKLQEVGRVLRGEIISTPTATRAPDAEPQELPLVAGKPGVSAEEVNLMELEAERLRTELDQRVTLANSIMLKVAGEREAFRKEQDAVFKQQQADKARDQDHGFQKQLDILTSLAPKTALEHLLALNDMHKAARILMSMETDQAKKIVESARRGEDLARMKVIVQLMQDVTPLAGADEPQESEER